MAQLPPAHHFIPQVGGGGCKLCVTCNLISFNCSIVDLPHSDGKEPSEQPTRLPELATKIS